MWGEKREMMKRTLIIAGLGMLIWSTSLLWPDVNSTLSLSTLLGLAAGLVIVVLIQQWFDPKMRSQYQPHGDDSEEATCAGTTRPLPAPWPAPPTRPLFAIEDLASYPTRPMLLTSVSNHASRPTRPVAI